MENILGEKLELGTALVDAVLGYLVVFIGLALLMCVIIIVGKVMVSRAKKPAAETAAPFSCADMLMQFAKYSIQFATFGKDAPPNVVC